MPRNLPLRGHKLTPYEGGIRVPLIVKWPGVTKAGSVCGAYMIIEDLFPTFLEMTGVEHDGIIDGVSLVPLLTRKSGYDDERAIFWHYPNTYDQPPYSVVRKGDWKLIYHHASQRLELFDVRNDIGEELDLAPQQRDRVHALAKLLGNYLRNVDAQMPLDIATQKPVPWPDDEM